MKLKIFSVLLPILIILISSIGWAQNSGPALEKKYCFDSVQVMKINLKFSECDFLKSENMQLLKSDSLNSILQINSEKKINNQNQIITEKDKIINELLSRPPTIVNNAKWYYYAGSVSIGILLGVVLGFAIK